MKNVISKENIAILLEKMNDYALRLKSVKTKFSVDFMGIGVSNSEIENALFFYLEVYLDGQEELGLILSTSIQVYEGVLTGSCNIITESGSFFISPKYIAFKEDGIPEEFLITLYEYYNILELAVRSYILDKEDYISMLGNG